MTDQPCTARIRRWALRHAHTLFITMLVLVVCELMVLSAVSK